jgi:hypothetical protein
LKSGAVWTDEFEPEFEPGSPLALKSIGGVFTRIFAGEFALTFVAELSGVADPQQILNRRNVTMNKLRNIRRYDI